MPPTAVAAVRGRRCGPQQQIAEQPERLHALSSYSKAVYMITLQKMWPQLLGQEQRRAEQQKEVSNWSSISKN